MKIKVTQAQLKEMVDNAIKNNLEKEVTEDLNLPLGNDENLNEPSVSQNNFKNLSATERLRLKDIECFGYEL